MSELDGVVVSFGEEVADYGNVIAAASGRGHIHVESAENIVNINRLEMLVMRSCALTCYLLDRIYSHGRLPVPGLVLLGVDNDDREIQLRRFRRRLENTGNPVTHLSFMPWLKHDQIAFEDRVCLGDHASSQKAKALMERRWDVISICGHSDGLDLRVGDKLVCPISDRSLEQNNPIASCVVTGICHQTNRATSEIVRSSTILRPEDFNARIVLLLTCMGVPTSRSLIRYEDTITSGLIRNPKIDAVVTTWGSAALVPAHLEVMIQMLRQGTSLGEAVYRTNSCNGVKRSASKLCILGDPRIRLCQSNSNTPRISRSLLRSCYGIRGNPNVTTAHQASAGEQEKQPPDFLSTYLRTVFQFMGKSMLPTWRRATGSLECWHKERSRENHREMAKRILIFLSTDIGLRTDVWQQFYRCIGGASVGASCLVCQSVMKRWDFRPKASDLSPRVLNRCDECGSVCDLPKEFPVGKLGLLDEGKLGLGEPWVTADGGAVLCFPQLASLKRFKLWPRSDTGLVSELVYDRPPLAVPFHLVCTFLIGGEVASFRLARAAGGCLPKNGNRVLNH